MRSYIEAARSDDFLQQQEALRWVCSGLEYMLGVLLDGNEGWNGWVDGILPATDYLSDAVSVVAPDTLSVRGCALWGRHAGGSFWIEPFLGSVQILDASDVIVNYDFKFGDAARGLAKVPFDKHLRYPNWFFPERWLYTFANGRSSKAEGTSTPDQG
ncbi:MAG TPA: hypothetical protein VKV15_05770 [Bryobacteraceae bacterium]|nr:hypothetical protein [Bryobacteraceae bacterium]